MLGDLLFKIAGTCGKALLEGDSDDEGTSAEAHGRVIIKVLGRDKRNEVFTALYMVRVNVSFSVRQAALTQNKIFKDVHQEALRRDIERLGEVYQ